jgi:hypothetical protein
VKYWDTPKQTGVFWTREGESFMLLEGKCQKTLYFFEKSTFTCFGAVLYWGSMQGFGWRIFFPRSHFQAGASRVVAIF